MMIRTIKTNEEKANEIIDLLKDKEVIDKYLIIKGLWESLNDVIERDGIMIFDNETGERLK